MKIQITRWINFSWVLAEMEATNLTLPKGYNLEVVDPEDHAELREVIDKSLALDPNWNSTLHEISALVMGALDRTLPPLRRSALRFGMAIASSVAQS